MYLQSADSGRLITTSVVEERCIVVNDEMRIFGHVQSVLITQIQTVCCSQTFQKSLKTFRSVKIWRWAQFSLNRGCSHHCFLFAAVIHFSHKTNRNSSNLSEKMKVLHFVIYKILIFWCRLQWKLRFGFQIQSSVFWWMLSPANQFHEKIISAEYIKPT